MATDAQIAANRRNAEKSTGPRTVEGKDNSRRNALRHGLAAAHIVIFDEDPNDFARFDAAMRAALEPVGEGEETLCDRIVPGNWRLRRIWRMEAAALNEAALDLARSRARKAAHEAVAQQLKDNPPPPEPEPTPSTDGKFKLYKPSPYAIAHDVVRQMTDAEIEENFSRHDESDASGALRPLDMPVWPERMTGFSRYEAAIERGLHRARSLLQRLQAQCMAAETAAAGDEPPATLSRQQRRFTERSQFSGAARASRPNPDGAPSGPKGTNGHPQPARGGTGSAPNPRPKPH
jgi:hypothetical protein